MGKFESMVSLHKTISESEEYGGGVPHNWRRAIESPLESGDVSGMKEAGLPALQLQMLQLAHNSKSENIRYQATAFLLSQSGHGPMNRVEHTVDYKRMPTDQLQSIIQNKLQALTKLNPAFDVKALLSSNPNPEFEGVEVYGSTEDVSRGTFEGVIESEIEESESIDDPYGFE